VGLQNVTDIKAGNILPSEQNLSLLYSFSQVNFDIFLDINTQVYEKYFDHKPHLLKVAFYIIFQNSFAIEINEGLRHEIFI
jgi:hypothetical protein